MSTYTQILYQIVFGTKKHERTLTYLNRSVLFKYIGGILKNQKCHMYCINGVENHLHIITHIHPTVSLSSLIKDIKIASSVQKKKKLFQQFSGWQDGYGAFTYSVKEKERLIEYVKTQEEHHKKKTFKEEYIELLNEYGIEFDDKYLL